MNHTLSELAGRFQLELKGDARVGIVGVCALTPGRSGHLAYCADEKSSSNLSATAASAVVLRPANAVNFQGNALLSAQPALAFARIAAWLDPRPDFSPDSVHPTAVIGAGVKLGRGSCVGPGCVIGAGAVIGEDTQLSANVYVWPGVRIGARGQIHPGAVLGSRGFGNVPSPAGWVAMPQLGSVRIGDDVEIGANTCIDRGTFDDTVIEDGVKIDNLVQIAHNVQIGAHTAIAACVGIAGSTRIGARCMIGGACGISGHIRIGDGVIIAAGSMVTKSLPGPGQYAGPLPAGPVRQWRRQIAWLRRQSKQGESDDDT